MSCPCGDPKCLSYVGGWDSINVLTGLEAVRKRPFMYVGKENIANVLLQSAFQTVEMDAATGVLHKVSLSLGVDCRGWVTIDGPAVPVTPFKSQGPLASYFATEFLVPGPQGWPVLNALSETFELHVFKNGEKWTQTFTKGVAQGPLTLEGVTSDEATMLNFKLDQELLGPLAFDVPEFLQWFEKSGPPCILTVQDLEGQTHHAERKLS